MLVKLLTDLAGRNIVYKAGEILKLDKSKAEYLIKIGRAEKVSKTSKKEDKSTKETKEQKDITTK